VTYITANTLVHALISSRVDYCNTAIYGACVGYLRPLQSVLNGAARLIVRKRKYDHITDTIRHDLHWLPVRQRIQYKLCTLEQVHRRTWQTSAFPCRLQPVDDISNQLLITNDLTIPRSRLARYGSRSFAT